jgi:hypothetical protein
LQDAGLPLLATNTHIVPVMVGDPELCMVAGWRELDLPLEKNDRRPVEPRAQTVAAGG